MSRPKKDTGRKWLGSIPEDWELLPLGRIFEERREATTAIDASPLSVTKRGVVDQLDDVAVSLDGAPKKLVRKGDIVINSRSDRKGSSGLSPRDGSVSVINTVLHPMGVDPRYAHHLIRSTAFQEEFYRFGSGIVADLWTTRWTAMKSITMPVPPMAEQRLIADYLDREIAEIDAFISDLQVLFHLASEHFSSLRSKVLCQPSSVEKESGSPSVPLTRVLPHRVDYRGATPTKVDDGIQLVTARNIRPGWIDYESSQEFVSSRDYSQVMSRGLPAIGDILFTMEAPLGNAALVDRTDVALAQRVIKFTPAPGVDSSFICHVMNSDEFQHQLRELATGSTALGLKASKLHQLQVLVPDLATQERVARTLDDAWSSVVELQCLVDEATRLASERRAALISAAVTGQIDVTVQGASTSEQLRDELEVHV